MTFDDVVLDPAPTVGDAARRDWRWYAPAWAVPPVLLVGAAAEAAGMVSGPVMFAAVAVVFGFAQLVAAFPLWIGRATRRQHAILALLTPLALWGLCVFAVLPLVSGLAPLR